ncbi:MAG: hypothetical protein DRR19_19670 [Candidatus Parabeggiatoa sp. nov. 1]|nr:MAG: hypothetical protein DRR19_19670 [Gammaproteobacteria bacterium]
MLYLDGIVSVNFEKIENRMRYLQNSKKGIGFSESVFARKNFCLELGATQKLTARLQLGQRLGIGN